MLSATNANIFCISIHIYLKKRIYIDMLMPNCTYSFENNSATASCNIRYQTANNFINELDIFTDRTTVVIYAGS